jgi:hypothetical protein
MMLIFQKNQSLSNFTFTQKKYLRNDNFYLKMRILGASGDVSDIFFC